MSWPKLTIYIILFLLLLLEPHVIRGHVLGFDASYAQSATTLVIIVLAGVTHFMHRRDLASSEREQKRLTDQALESFRYVAQANHRVPFIEEMTTHLLVRKSTTKRERQAQFEHLLTLAVVSTARADWGLLRFVAVGKTRTIAEFWREQGNGQNFPSRISNGQLLRLETGGGQVVEDGVVSFLGSSDATAPVRCFLALPSRSEIQRQRATLQALVDQAQLLYKYHYDWAT